MLLADLLGNAARNQNADEKQDDKSDSSSGSSSNVLFDGSLEEGQASGGVDDVLGLGFGLVNDSVSAIRDVINAAKFGNFSCKKDKITF